MLLIWLVWRDVDNDELCNWWLESAENEWCEVKFCGGNGCIGDVGNCEDCVIELNWDELESNNGVIHGEFVCKINSEVNW